jgi:hypothetical protein
MTQTPPSLASEFSEASNPTLQARIQMATAKAAQDISSEAEDTANHQARVNLASAVARNPSMYTSAFTTMLCAQGITNASTDAEISSMVSAVWNTIAGTPIPPLPL